MVGTKLELLRLEISKYLGLPYHTNIPKIDSPEASLVGKGSAKEIALKTIEFANAENIKLIELNPQQIYNFQKKHKLGIDCSGLACHLLNFYFNLNLNVRHTSADMLTSKPLSKQISISEAQTGDLIRQNSGRHVVFIVEKKGNQITYVESSRKGRGVHYASFSIGDKAFKYDGVYRLNR
jgi:hypothetical protein